jgi:hypothetical protein
MDGWAIAGVVIGALTLAAVLWGLWRGSVRLAVDVEPAGTGIRITVTNRGGRVAEVTALLLLYGADPEDVNERKTLPGSSLTLASWRPPWADRKVRPDRWIGEFDSATLHQQLGRSDAPGYLRVTVRDASPVTKALSPAVVAIIGAANPRPAPSP